MRACSLEIVMLLFFILDVLDKCNGKFILKVCNPVRIL
jgi:hypothetical protein